MAPKDNPEFGGSTPEVILDDAKEFYSRLRYWKDELNLAALYLDQKEFGEFCVDVIAEVDAICPYLHEPICISGKALLPDPSGLHKFEDEENEQDRPVSQIKVLDRNDEDETVYAEVDSMIGIHNGITIALVEDDETGESNWHLRHMVAIGRYQYSLAKATRCVSETVFGYFDVDSEIITIDSIDEAVSGHDLNKPVTDEIVDAVDYYSGSMRRLLNSKRFRGLPHKRQLELFENLMDEAEMHAPVRDKEVAIYLMYTAKTPRSYSWPGHYVYIPETEGGAVRYKKRHFTGDIIGGICMGLTSLEAATLHERPIRKPRDLKDPKAGLCLAIAPDDVTSERTGAEKLIYVPISAQDFDATFDW